MPVSRKCILPVTWRGFLVQQVAGGFVETKKTAYGWIGTIQERSFLHQVWAHALPINDRAISASERKVRCINWQTPPARQTIATSTSNILCRCVGRTGIGMGNLLQGFDRLLQPSAASFASTTTNASNCKRCVECLGGCREHKCRINISTEHIWCIELSC